MARKTIHSVIADVLVTAGRPMTLREIYDTIVTDQLYEFRSKAPFGIVRNQLKRHCIENNHACAPSKKLFKQVENDTYTLL